MPAALPSDTSSIIPIPFPSDRMKFSIAFLRVDSASPREGDACVVCMYGVSERWQGVMCEMGGREGRQAEDDR